MNQPYISSLLWTVKIAGVSGTGKTTIMTRLGKTLGCTAITYSNLLKKYGGDQELADYELAKILAATKGLALMDEHLEFHNPNKARNYRRENTRGLILLDSPLDMLIERIEKDIGKTRKVDKVKLSADLRLSRITAMKLSRELRIPLLVVSNLNDHVDDVYKLIYTFLQSLKP